MKPPFLHSFLLLAGLSALTTRAFAYEPFELFPLTLGTTWSYSDGSIARVSEVAESGGKLYVTITNANTVVRGPGSLKVTDDGTQVQPAGSHNANYIMYSGETPYYPIVIRPMRVGQKWTSYWNYDGYRIYQAQTITSTNKSVALGPKVYHGCTEVTSVITYPNGYSTGQTLWTTIYYYFLPGVGCVKRTMTSDSNKTNHVYATSWTIKDSATPVVIMDHPSSQYGVTGKAATLTVSAYGSSVVSFQWKKNGENLVNGGRVSGATSASLTVTNLTTADAGKYSVLVKNAAGALESEPAELWIIPASRTFSLGDYFWPMYPGNEWVYDNFGNRSPLTIRRVEADDYDLTVYRGCSPPQPVVRKTARIYGAYGYIDGSGSFVPSDEWWDYPVVLGDTWGQLGYDDNPGEMEMRLGPGMLITNRVLLGKTYTLNSAVHVNGVCQGAATMTLSVVDYTNVTTSAGRFFPECLHLKLTRTTPGRTEYDDQWWANGLGMVLKIRKVVKTTETYTESFELSRFSVVSAPRITRPLLSQTNVLGSSVTFTIEAMGTAPLHYQWLKNGVALADGDRVSGSSGVSLSIANLQYADAGLFSVAVRNDYGSITSAPASLVITDRNPPGLALTSHTNMQWVNTSAISLRGMASDAGFGDHGISFVTVNGKRASQDTAPDSSTASWSITVPLLPGTNVIKVVASDTWSNRTTNTIKILFDTTRPTLGFYWPTSAQEVGESTIRVRAWAKDNAGLASVLYQLNGTGWISAAGTTNWTEDLALISGLNVLQAYAVDINGNRSTTNTLKFTYNRFLPARGTYYGLASTETRQHDGSGFFTLTVGSSGSFSGSMVLGGRTNLLSGSFDAEGYSFKTLTRPGTSPSALRLNLDLTPGSDSITGTVSNADWIASLWGDRAVWNSTTNKAPYAGKYTLTIPGDDDGNDEPCGWGFGALTVDASGKVVASGYLADGTPWSQSTRISKQGRWPLYVPLYSGKGSLFGWLQFGTAPEATLVGGNLSWNKPALGTKTRHYPRGFSFESVAIGSGFIAPTSLNPRVLEISDAIVRFEGGNLCAPCTNRVFLNVSNTISNSSLHGLKMTISAANGTWNGSVVVPGPYTTNSFRGVVLQNQQVGCGYLLGPNKSSMVIFQAASEPGIPDPPPPPNSPWCNLD